MNNKTKLSTPLPLRGGWVGLQEQQAKDAMRETFVKLMKLKQEDGVRWVGTVSDLVELAHMMWYDGASIDECGRLLNFSDTVSRLCGALGVKPPRKPHTVMNNIRKRKTPTLGLLARCQQLMQQGEEPLERMVKKS